MPEFATEETNGDVLYAMNGEKTSFLMDRPSYGAFTFRSGSGIDVESVFAQFGDFSESLALRERRKPHTSEDGLELSLDAANPIPFGAEPRVERTFRFDGDALAVSTTFILRHSFQMRSIFAGGLKFTGNIAKFAVQEIPQTPGPAPLASALAWQDAAAVADDTIVFDADRPPLRFSAAGPDGASVEFEIGENIWRWVNANRISGTCRYTVTKRNGGFEFGWQLYSFKPETEESLPPDGRDWRIRYKLIRHDARQGKPFKAADCKTILNVADLQVPESASVPNCTEKHACLCAAPTLNAAKKQIRKMLADAQDGDVFGITEAAPFICRSAAHMDRAKLKDLIHWDGPAFQDLVRWANRQLARNGAKLVILNSNNTISKRNKK